MSAPSWGRTSGSWRDRAPPPTAGSAGRNRSTGWLTTPTPGVPTASWHTRSAVEARRQGRRNRARNDPHMVGTDDVGIDESMGIEVLHADAIAFRAVIDGGGL